MADTPQYGFRIDEVDQTGRITTFVNTINDEGTSRIDKIESSQSPYDLRALVDIFLPAGYPESVTDDYTQYRIYESLQSFFNTIAGLFASRAILEGIGVGDASATATASVILSVVQNSLGRLTTIVSAHRFGMSLQSECKMYRFVADIVNDIALVLDCISPAFPSSVRFALLAFSSILKAIVGFTSGAKASLSQHFAKSGNLAELNAKDGSQTTILDLVAMLTGSLLISYVTDPSTTWSILVLLLAMHLGMNWRAVRAVRLNTLNRQRATIVFAEWISAKNVPTLDEVAQLARHLINTAAANNAPYIVWLAHRRCACIMLSEGCSAREQLKAWYTAQLAVTLGPAEAHGWMSDQLRTVYAQADREYGALEAALLAQGWDIDTAALQSTKVSHFAVPKLGKQT